MEDEEVSQVSTVWIFYSTGISVKSNLEVIPTENLLFFFFRFFLWYLYYFRGKNTYLRFKESVFLYIKKK